jgi:hypothetical protein
MSRRAVSIPLAARNSGDFEIPTGRSSWDDRAVRLAHPGGSEQLVDQVILLDKGRLVACDSPRGLRATTGSATLEEALERLTPPGFRAEVLS